MGEERWLRVGLKRFCSMGKWLDGCGCKQGALQAMGYEVLDSMGCGIRFPASQHGNSKSPMGYWGIRGIRGMG